MNGPMEKGETKMNNCTACDKTATTTYKDFLGFEWPSCDDCANEMKVWHEEQAALAARYDGHGNYNR